ncbi:hypothetical protein JYT72_02440 [Crocinitomix catalasitica]|nr:hypothetical protein [Crocinitomix catalasitica]
MTINQLISIFRANGCTQWYAKALAENDNSKEQIYLGPNFRAVNFIPNLGVYTDKTGARKNPTYKAKLIFFWLDKTGNKEQALRTKLIWYPKYPEVRLSGFLHGCKLSPSHLMKAEKRIPGRVLFIGVNDSAKKIYALCVRRNDSLAKEFKSKNWVHQCGVCSDLSYVGKLDPRVLLLRKLKAIHKKGFLPGAKLDKHGVKQSYKAQNGGGFTLEAQLNIVPNSSSIPDFLGWELKQFGVTKFDTLNGKRITLITPEPDGGYYAQNDLIDFAKEYGILKTSGNRYDFTGVHKCGILQQKTKLLMQVDGFDFQNNEILKEDGSVALLDHKGNVALSWSFGKLIEHWEVKHAQAAYVPSIKRSRNETTEYHFGNIVVLGTGTSFWHFITGINFGVIDYDPAVKLTNVKKKPRGKPRNQFRFSTSFFNGLYDHLERIDLTP